MLSWNEMGWKEGSSDLVLTQIPMLTSWGNWSELCTRAIHAKKIEMLSKIHTSAMGGQEKIVGERADGLRLS